jgi:hypothetical protein
VGLPAHGRRRAARGERNVTAWARPAQNDFADHFSEKEKLQFFEQKCSNR